MPFINLGDLEVYYQTHGQGEPLLLIHGLGSSSRDWELQLPVFAGRYQVICLDLRGHGQTGKPPGPYSMSLFAEDAALLLRHLGIGPFHVLGISLGGMVAFELALTYPALVQSLIIVNSTPDMVPKSFKDRFSLWQRILIVRLLGMKKMGQVLADRFLPREDQAELREIFIQRWAGNNKPAYLESIKAAVGWSVRDRLGEIACPALVVGSDGDYFPISDKRDYTEMIPAGQLAIVADSRHALPAEKPAEFNQLVLDFLAGLA